MAEQKIIVSVRGETALTVELKRGGGFSVSAARRGFDPLATSAELCLIEEASIGYAGLTPEVEMLARLNDWALRLNGTSEDQFLEVRAVGISQAAKPSGEYDDAGRFIP